MLKYQQILYNLIVSLSLLAYSMTLMDFYKKHMSLTPRTDKKTDRGTGRDTDRKHDTLRKASPIKKTLKKTRV